MSEAIIYFLPLPVDSAFVRPFLW